MAFTKVVPAGIGTSPGDGYRVGDSFFHATGLQVGGSGIVTATPGSSTLTYYGDGSNLIGAGVGTDGSINTSGVITATSFSGDGSNLTSLPAGLGTALSSTQTDPLNKIYYTDSVLSVGATITINPPSSASAAYTQYTDIVADGADIIVADGDDFIPDILGISTDTVPSYSGSGGRVRAGKFTNTGANGAPTAPNGWIVTGVSTATTFKGNLIGNVTGNVTGTASQLETNATGANLTLSGNLGVGGTITYEDVARIDATGISTFREGYQVGPLAGIALTAYKDGSIRTTGIITATTVSVGGSITAGNKFYGDGSQLTGISAGVSLSGSTNNTVCTVTGSNAIAGEANLTWDGDYLVLHKASSAETYIRFTNTTTGTGTANGSYVGLDGDENLRLWNIEDKHIRMCTNNIERIRIENDGDVYIGNSDATGGHLFVFGKNGNSEPATIEFHGKNGSGGGNPKAQVKGVNNTYAWASDLRFYTQDHNINLAEHFRIQYNGDLLATDTTIGSLSDSRLKTNISNYTYDLDKFKQFQPKTFDWKNPVQHGGKSGVRGFLAQDLEAVDPFYVSSSSIEKTVTKGNEDGTTTTSTNPDLQYLDADGIAKSSKFGQKDAMYISIINQLIAKIETLETKVSVLESS
jgi:hypothetical protein